MNGFSTLDGTVNVLALRGDCLSRRVTFHPENVPCSVHVAVMDRSALVAGPLSHSERTHAFGAARGDAPTSGARPGSVSLAHLRILNPVLYSFIAEHRPESGNPGRTVPPNDYEAGYEQAAHNISAEIRELAP